MTCIAVACAPGELAACRTDNELTCNSVGTGYDMIQCERGCDPVAGCRVCQPDQTVCANGKVQTCDATGAITSSEACPLGCFEDQPRCRNIDASNNLSKYLDMVADLPDIDLTNALFTTDTGVVEQASTRIALPSFLDSGRSGGVQIRVFVANHVHLKDVRTRSSLQSVALAIVARHDIVIEGRVSLDRSAGSYEGGCAEAGQFFGDQFTSDGTEQAVFGGDGGGGHATPGATGGDVDGQGTPRGAGGGRGASASGAESLVPLRGGCPGGGALQLSSDTSITINGIIDARGNAGQPGTARFTFGNANGGGGAGGGILIEAPKVTLGPSARLIAKGGAGATQSSDGFTPDNDDIVPAIGWHCVPPSPFCGNGGDGASVGVAATDGATIPYTNSNSALVLSAGGGGGGMGRVRINTRDGVYTKSSTTIEMAVLTTAVIQTR
jgi:hypothetical protein